MRILGKPKPPQASIFNTVCSPSGSVLPKIGGTRGKIISPENGHTTPHCGVDPAAARVSHILYMGLHVWLTHSGTAKEGCAETGEIVATWRPLAHDKPALCHTPFGAEQMSADERFWKENLRE
jgi:hypothetical protein